MSLFWLTNGIKDGTHYRREKLIMHLAKAGSVSCIIMEELGKYSNTNKYNRAFMSMEKKKKKKK